MSIRGLVNRGRGMPLARYQPQRVLKIRDVIYSMKHVKHVVCFTIASGGVNLMSLLEIPTK